ncbi:MAG: hypothetical protein IKJ94_04515 [Oscillospiraceae bacterium]|nr:hypothetical protein [Oscillospiraceae bacterium]
MSIVIHRFHKHRRNVFGISLAWIFGLLAGLLVALRTVTIHNTWTRSLQQSELSVVGFLATLIFPYFLSAILFKVSLWEMILPLIFLKAFSYSWCATSIVCMFGHSGWLFRLLLLFSDSLSVSCLLWFWIRNYSGNSVSGWRDLLLCFCLVLALGCFDCCLISPFAGYLLLYY